MAQSSESGSFTIVLTSPSQPDPERMDRLARGMRSEIKEIGYESIALAADKTKAEGSKGIEAILPGALILKGAVDLMPKLFEYLQSWVMRGQNQSVKIEVQRGENKISLSYTPASTTHEDINVLIEKLNQNLK